MDSLWSEPPGKPPEHSGVGYNLFPLTSVLVVSPFSFLPVFFFISSVIFNSDCFFFKQVVMKIQKGCLVVLERGVCVQTYITRIKSVLLIFQHVIPCDQADGKGCWGLPHFPALEVAKPGGVFHFPLFMWF